MCLLCTTTPVPVCYSIQGVSSFLERASRAASCCDTTLTSVCGTTRPSPPGLKFLRVWIEIGTGVAEAIAIEEEIAIGTKATTAAVEVTEVEIEIFAMNTRTSIMIEERAPQEAVETTMRAV